jgi:predicted solute-binding protein
VKATVSVVSDGQVTGSVRVTVGSRSYDVALDKNGRGSVLLPKLGRGQYTVSATFAGTDTVSAAKSPTRTLWIVI